MTIFQVSGNQQTNHKEASVTVFPSAKRQFGLPALDTDILESSAPNLDRKEKGDIFANVPGMGKEVKR